ncbi:hypothetical protein EST38_g3199 [Candolleomyces aberdarensis]|uniref:Uncharacterized protein n=1 Tax=Candolleomyces aberdarensis TaxID=2316362 RepID=A0A4Q2DUQ5_9AGAR|nr:hypothetical protein EST38_g3199 [Candolleomyces aberdarensis]
MLIECSDILSRICDPLYVATSLVFRMATTTSPSGACNVPPNVSKRKRSRQDSDSDPITSVFERRPVGPSASHARLPTPSPISKQRFKTKKGDHRASKGSCTTGATFHILLKLVGGKPVIYLYPPTATRVSTKLSLVLGWEFLAIYPVVPAKTRPQKVNTGLEVSFVYWEAETNAHNLLSPPASPLLPKAVTEIFIPNRATLDTTNSVLVEVGKITPYLDINTALTHTREKA